MMATHMEPPGPWRRPWRAMKTVFFLFSMLGSLLLFSAPPLLVAVIDIIIPTAILNASSFHTLFGDLRSFDFRASLVDVPLLSIARSLLILCVYGACDVPARSRGPYMWVTTISSLASAAYVGVKAIFVSDGRWRRRLPWDQLERGGEGLGTEVVMPLSMVLAAAHVLAAYRTSCRERRKLLVYRIDVEGVSCRI